MRYYIATVVATTASSSSSILIFFCKFRLFEPALLTVIAHDGRSVADAVEVCARAEHRQRLLDTVSRAGPEQ
jgi:hypothetical protein